MNILKKTSAIILAIFISLCFCACSRSDDSIMNLHCFNTEVYIQCDKNIPHKAQDKIKNLLNKLESDLTANCESSIVSQFNSANQNAVFSLDDNALEILSVAKKIYEFSNGVYDPSVYPLVKLWGFAPYSYTAEFTPPTQSQIETALSQINFNGALIDYDLKTLTKTNPNTSIDLGGVVKGYAVDRVAQILNEHGVTSGYVSIGGSSLNLLSVQSLGIRHPRKTYGNALLTVNCQNKTNISVSTSGDYEKYYLGQNGKVYCHLIDPKTGYTANTGVASATLIGISGAESDALTTAICLQEHSTTSNTSPLINFLKKIKTSYPNCEIYVVYQKDDCKTLFTNQIQGEDFTLHDNDYSVVNI